MTRDHSQGKRTISRIPSANFSRSDHFKGVHNNTRPMSKHMISLVACSMLKRFDVLFLRSMLQSGPTQLNGLESAAYFNEGAIPFRTVQHSNSGEQDALVSAKKANGMLSLMLIYTLRPPMPTVRLLCRMRYSQERPAHLQYLS